VKKRMGRPAVIWTPEMIRALKELRAAGVKLLVCAERIGVSYTVVCKKAQELGLAGRRRP
jgi:hypothetical protein